MFLNFVFLFRILLLYLWWDIWLRLPCYLRLKLLRDVLDDVVVLLVVKLLLALLMAIGVYSANFRL